jgi:hypothetical protein
MVFLEQNLEQISAEYFGYWEKASVCIILMFQGSTVPREQQWQFDAAHSYKKVKYYLKETTFRSILLAFFHS